MVGSTKVSEAHSEDVMHHSMGQLLSEHQEINQSVFQILAEERFTGNYKPFLDLVNFVPAVA